MRMLRVVGESFVLYAAEIFNGQSFDKGEGEGGFRFDFDQ